MSGASIAKQRLLWIVSADRWNAPVWCWELLRSGRRWGVQVTKPRWRLVRRDGYTASLRRHARRP